MAADARWSELWLADEPPGLINALTAAGTRRTLRDGEWLYAKGDAGEGLVGVTSGAIRHIHQGPDGRELLFGLFPAGQWFGEVSLFDADPRPLHAIAEGATQVVLVPTAAAHAVLSQHPQGYLHFARVLSRKLRVSLETLEDIPRPLSVRLGKRLLDLAAVYGRNLDSGVLITLPLTQDELARMLGATRQSINKELGLLTQRGLLVQTRGRIALPNPQALQQWIALP